VTIADWREEYNTEHPHSRLDFQSPADLFFGRPPGFGRASPSLHRGPTEAPRTNHNQSTNNPA
ncbi:MAG: hypothetical protein ACFE0O_00955, partial [Opitutales bacterium]